MRQILVCIFENYSAAKLLSYQTILKALKILLRRQKRAGKGTSGEGSREDGTRERTKGG